MGDKLNEKLNNMKIDMREKFAAFVEDPCDKTRGDLAFLCSQYQTFMEQVKTLVD